ncbi:histidine phosphatase superfamily [Schizophyllum fasciatum]
MTVTGFFVHEDIGSVPPRFGLKDESNNRWQTLFAHIHNLNKSGTDDALYKLFLLGRHGQGYHNVAESKYGTRAWDDYWSKLTGDGEITWGPDPELTPLGKAQAAEARAVWQQETAAGLPLPKLLLSSPFTRALDTLRITFDGLQTVRALVLEVGAHVVISLRCQLAKSDRAAQNCREVSGVHTCDKRRTRSYIQSTFPEVDIEDGFTEEDEYYEDDVRESPERVVARARAVLCRVFEDREQEFVSITAHGGWINAFLTAVGREHYALPTGGVFPVIVKCAR